MELAINIPLSVRKAIGPNLFWKIFLWFWLATITVLLSLVFLYSFTDKETRLVSLSQPERLELRKTAIFIQKKRLLDKYQNATFLRPKTLEKTLENTLIINRNGQEIFERDIPDSVYSLRAFNKRTMKMASAIDNNTVYYGPEIIFNRGIHYQLFLVKKSKNHFYSVLSSLYLSASIWHVLTALGISAVVCFGLAGYIIRPIQQLRKATREFSDGNLKTPATDYIGSRQDEFSDLASDFDRMANKIDTILNSQKRLLSDVSHELRSPLTRMQIASGLALKQTNSETEPYLNRIEIEIERLNEMIGELLQVSTLESGSVFEQKTKFCVNDLLSAIVTDANFEAEANKKSVSLSAPEDIEFVGYHGLFSRAVENIIRNAIRHTDEDTEVQVKLYYNMGEIIIDIIDQGPGVNQEHLRKIFEPFYRPTEARERTSGGAGLGLAIAKQSIEANSGIISAQNATDSGYKKGLLVSIRLPK